eukprot:GHVR01033901.1.p1 GENE.GHVR01033901.1~~GHVR01033901.1.p1  ORF type:complete len:151 (-),score=9.64 GHVR01033901.1:300-752(-)
MTAIHTRILVWSILVDKGSLSISMQKYLCSIQVPSTKRSKLTDKHARHKYYKQSQHTSDTVQRFQQLLGKNMWVARTLPNFAYAIGEISRRSTTATEDDSQKLNKLTELMQTKWRPLVLKAIYGTWLSIHMSPPKNLVLKLEVNYTLYIL